MPKVFDTKWFADKNTPLLEQLYEERVGCPLDDLTLDHIYDPTIMRALAELRTYRLPPYFKVPAAIKSRIQVRSGVCHSLEDPQRALEVERELVHPGSPYFTIVRRPRPCKRCFTRRAAIDGVCYECITSDMKLRFKAWQEEELRVWQDKTRIRPCPEIFRRFSEAYPGPWGEVCEVDTIRELETELRKMYVARSQSSSLARFDPDMSWVSPKAALLAELIGCHHCGAKHKVDWLYNDVLDGWYDGVCGDCAPLFPLRYEWSLPKNPKAASPQTSYEVCQKCLSNTYDYALWGMCEACYQEWQDSFIDPERLKPLVDTHGALSALLIRSSVEWVNYLKTTLGAHYTREGLPIDHTVVRLKLPTRRPKTLSEAGLNLEEILRDVSPRKRQ